MLSSVSWRDLIVTLVVLVIVYYAVIIALFFRNDIISIVKSGSWKFPKEDPKAVVKEPELFAGINELLEDLKAVFHTSLTSTYHKEELMQALSSTLKDHQQLKGTEFEAAINQHIIQTAESSCAIFLDETDIKQIW